MPKGERKHERRRVGERGVDVAKEREWDIERRLVGGRRDHHGEGVPKPVNKLDGEEETLLEEPEEVGVQSEGGGDGCLGRSRPAKIMFRALFGRCAPAVGVEIRGADVDVEPSEEGQVVCDQILGCGGAEAIGRRAEPCDGIDIWMGLTYGP
jgi:hypothetical protein